MSDRLTDPKEWVQKYLGNDLAQAAWRDHCSKQAWPFFLVVIGVFVFLALGIVVGMNMGSDWLQGALSGAIMGLIAPVFVWKLARYFQKREFMRIRGFN